MVSNNLGSDVTGEVTEKLSYCNWIHFKIIFRNQVMIKVVI
jgi:hypothetical protein